jgi:hypothetical protein
MPSTLITGNCCSIHKYSDTFSHAPFGSGDISLDELKIGLSKLSIFLYPYELREVRRATQRRCSRFS